MRMAVPIKAYSLESLSDLVSEMGLPKFRTKQLVQWLYQKGASSYDEMTNLPKQLRSSLSDQHPLFVPQLRNSQTSSDGTRKYVLSFHDEAIAETVGIPSEDGRLTVCCSTQAGCAMGCAFCATGKAGLTRSLLPGEITDQVAFAQDDFGARVTNVVFMGQGEPFANYENSLAALRILNNADAFGIGARHLTVSTCGIIRGIERLSEEPEQFTLAVSLHSAVQEIRDVIMPGVQGNPLPALHEALYRYTQATGRRFSFEYALMAGVNDSKECLDALVSYSRSLLCHVNLIPLNNVPGSPFKPVDASVVRTWENSLLSAGIACTIRKSKGADIAGACGQLANRVQS